MRALAADSSWVVREGVAGNSVTPVEVLRALAFDVDEEVRAAVAGNLGSPLEVLRALAIDEDEAVRAGVAGNAAAGASTDGPALAGGPAQGDGQVVPGRGRARRLQAPSLELPER